MSLNVTNDDVSASRLAKAYLNVLNDATLMQQLIDDEQHALHVVDSKSNNNNNNDNDNNNNDEQWRAYYMSTFTRDVTSVDAARWLSITPISAPHVLVVKLCALFSRFGDSLHNVFDDVERSLIPDWLVTAIV
jgi:hypothetical protein